jgi:hypothetical protein
MFPRVVATTSVLPLALGAGSCSEIRMMSSSASIFASNTWQPPARRGQVFADVDGPPKVSGYDFLMPAELIIYSDFV